MPRQNTVHSPASLKDLANRIREHAKMIDNAAVDLTEAAPGLSVSLPYQQKVEEGLVAINLMGKDVAKKITQQKFVEVIAAQESKKPAKRGK
jgi:hypothetical protein